MEKEEILREVDRLIAEAQEHIRKHEEHMDKVYIDVHGVTYAEFKKVWDEVCIDISDEYETPKRT